MRRLSWLKRHPDIGVLALFALLSVLLTYPLIFNFTRAVPGHGADDPYLAWNLWWVKWSLLDLGTNPLFSTYIFYPIGVNLGTYTLTLLNGILSIPVQLAWDVIPANNLIVLFSITVASFGAYLLATDLLGRERTAATFGAIGAGLVYGFGAYRFNYLYLGHFNFNSNEWLPYYVFFLQRIFRNKSGMLHAGLMAGFFLVFTGWTESTFAAFLALFTAFFLLFRLSVERAGFFRRQVIFNLTTLFGVGFVGLLPLILSVSSDLARYGDFLLSSPNRAVFLSADLLSFFIPSEHNPLLGFLSRDLPYHNMDFAFVGYVTLLLAAVGLAAMRTRADWVFHGISALLFASIMLGPVLHVSNQSFNSIPLPFALIQSIPLLGANRLPVRYDHLVMLSIAVLAGGGVAVLQNRFANYTVLFLLMPTLILVEHLGVPLSMSGLNPPAVYRTIAADRGDFSILDLPLGWSSSTSIQGALFTQSQFYQTVHHKRLLGGNTSRPPPFEFQYFNELPVIHSLILLESGEPIDEVTIAADVQAAPELERFFDLRYVIALRDKTDQRVLDYASQVLSLTPLSVEDGVLAFRVTLQPATGLTIDHAEALSRMYFDDEWGRPQGITDGMAFRWATSSRSVLYVPLTQSDYQMCGLYAGAREGQMLSLAADGVPFAELRLTTNWTQRCVTVPARALHAGINSIAFETMVFSVNDPLIPEDRRIGRTGVTAPADIAVTSAGFPAGKFASLTFAGREAYETKRGFYLLAINPQSSNAPTLQMFDTFRDESESARLADFIRGLPPGTIVAGAVCDDASSHLTQDAVDALRTLGASSDLRARFRSSYAFVGVKGAAPGSAVEATDPTFPANVSVGKDVSTPNISFALGRLQFAQIAK